MYVVVKSQYVDRKEAYGILSTEAEDRHSDGSKNVEILVVKQLNLKKRLKTTLDIIEEGIGYR